MACKPYCMIYKSQRYPFRKAFPGKCFFHQRLRAAVVVFPAIMSGKYGATGIGQTPIIRVWVIEKRVNFVQSLFQCVGSARAVSTGDGIVGGMDYDAWLAVEFAGGGIGKEQPCAEFQVEPY